MVSSSELNAAQQQINAARDQTHTNIAAAKSWADLAKASADASGAGSAISAAADANRAEVAKDATLVARDEASGFAGSALLEADRAASERGLAEAARDRAEAVPVVQDGLLASIVSDVGSDSRAALNATYETQARAAARAILLLPQPAIADNAAAVQAAIDTSVSTGAAIDQRGIITVESPLAMKSNLKMSGAGRGSSVLQSSGCSLWEWQGHTARQVEFESMTMRSDGGHIVNLDSPTRDTTVKLLTMTGVEMATLSDDASIWRQRDQGQAIAVTYKDCTMFRLQTSTVPAWDVLVNGTLFNSIAWDGGEAHSKRCASSPFWRIENNSGQNYLVGLDWNNVVSEQALGGVIHLYAATAFTIRGVVDWDADPDQYVADLFRFASSGGRGCVGGFVHASWRQGGTLAPGVADVNAEDSTNRGILVSTPSRTGTGAVVKSGRGTSLLGDISGGTSAVFAEGVSGENGQSNGIGVRGRFSGGSGTALRAELTNSTVSLPNAKVYSYGSPARRAHDFQYMDANGETYSGNGTNEPIAGLRVGRVASLPAPGASRAGHICRVGDGTVADTLHICHYNGSAWEWRTI